MKYAACMGWVENMGKLGNGWRNKIDKKWRKGKWLRNAFTTIHPNPWRDCVGRGRPNQGREG